MLHHINIVTLHIKVIVVYYINVITLCSFYDAMLTYLHYVMSLSLCYIILMYLHYDNVTYICNYVKFT